MSEHINIKNVLESVIFFMEIAEEMEEGKLSGEDKKEYVMNRMKQKLGELFSSYETEINTILESVIFLSKIGRKIKVNDISKNCAGCFRFL
jgi:hypothetical protein